jgi:hypothetical protein
MWSTPVCRVPSPRSRFSGSRPSHHEVDQGILRADRSRLRDRRAWRLARSLAVLDASRAESQQELLREAAAAFGAVGFRSPATYRVPGWLAELPFEYDCTMPLSDPYEPQPGGCCSPWPYFIGDTVELPWTLTQDHTLFTVLRQRDIDPWLGQADRLRDAGGLIQLLPTQIRATSANASTPGFTRRFSTGWRSTRISGTRFRGTSRDRGDTATAQRRGVRPNKAPRC